MCSQHTLGTFIVINEKWNGRGFKSVVAMRYE